MNDRVADNKDPLVVFVVLVYGDRVRIGYDKIALLKISKMLHAKTNSKFLQDVVVRVIM